MSYPKYHVNKLIALVPVCTDMIDVLPADGLAANADRTSGDAYQ